MGKDIDVIPDTITLKLNPVNLTGGIDLGLDDIKLDLGLDNIKADLDLGLDDVKLDLGLDNIKADLDLGLDDVKLEADLGLDDIKLQADLGLDNVKVDLGLDNIKADLGLDDINVDLGLDNINACLSFAVTQIPIVRVHLPMKFDFGFRLFGKPVYNFCLSGERMLVTEDNAPKIFHPHKKSKSSGPEFDGPDRPYKVKIDEEPSENKMKS